MAVPEQTPYIEHIGNGATTSFALGFQCESKDHLIVLVDEIEPPIATWSLTGGNVVFTTAPTSGQKITLQRNTPFERTTDYQSYNNSFRPPAVNNDFDRVWRKLQELGLVDWLLSNRIDALKNYVDVQDADLQQNIDDLRLHSDQQDSLLQQNIENLKGYVDDKDDELRSYLLAEIQTQGVALDQLDEYYNYLMQRLAQIAADGGWDASLIAYGPLNQKQVNDGVNTIAGLLAVRSPQNNMRINVKGYHTPTLFVEANPYKGGGTFVWDATSTTAANNGTVFAINGIAAGRWIRQLADSEFITPQMFGAKATGNVADDDYHAIMAAINSVKTLQAEARAVGPTVFFPRGTYYSSETINLKSTVRLIGESSGLTGGAATIIDFAEGKDGIIVNRQNTNGPTGTTAQTTQADASLIDGLIVRQKGYIPRESTVLDFNPSISRFITYNVTYPLANGTDVIATNDYLVERFSAKIESIFSIGRVLVPSKYLNIPVGTVLTGNTSGAKGTVQYIGTKVLSIALSDVTGTFVVGETVTHGNDEFTIKSLSTVPASVLRVYSLTEVSGNLSYGDVVIRKSVYGSGIRLRGRATVRNCRIESFPHFGLCISTDGVTPGNANLCSVDNVSASWMGMHGFLTLGGDSNAGRFIGLNAFGCKGVGIKDSSFLGNHYFSCHTSVCGVASYASGPVNNFSVFVGCYSEGGGAVHPYTPTTSQIGKNSTVIGGDHGAPIGSSGLTFPTILNGVDFGFSNAIYLSYRLSASGQLEKPLCIGGSYTMLEALALVNRGNPGGGRGVGMSFYIPAGSQNNIKKDNSDTLKAGMIKVIPSNVNNGAKLDIDLFSKKKISSSLLTVSGGAASILPIVSSDGVLTGFQIADPGSGYTTAPTVTGRGEYNGLLATTEIFDGSVISVTIVTPPTMQGSLTPTDLQTALSIDSDTILPGFDNKTSIGSAALRFKDIYSATGTINTSDEREKQQIRDLSEAEKRVAVKLKSQIKAFKFNDAVSEKGDKARIHFGFIAQEVKAAFESEGLVAEDYAILCYDEWEAEYREITEEITATNDAGEEVTETVETGERELIREAGSRYGVRYEELLAFIISAL